MGSIYCYCCAFLLFSCAIISCRPKTVDEGNAYQAIFDSVLVRHPDFSGAILIAHEGKVIYRKAAGFSNFDQQIPMKINDVFELASLSKQFTAMAIMLLAEEGKLQYDDPIEKYLPELPYKGMTIRQLLHHTAGLPDYMELFDQYWDKTQVADNENIIHYLIQYHPPVLFAPSEKYAYSNTAYVLLGSIVERVSGESFESFLRERVFKKVAMHHTDLRTTAQKKEMEDFAWGFQFVPEKQRYVRVDSFPENDYAFYLGGRKGPGRVSSNTEDLLKWDQALWANSLVSPATLEEAFTSGHLLDGSSINYGFGWGVFQDSVAGKIVSHTGDNPGYRTKITRFLDHETTLIFLCNNQYEKHRELLRELEGKMRENIGKGK